MPQDNINVSSSIHVLSRGVIIDQDHILLCKTLDLVNNFFFLPGGHVEYGESTENALKRELLEESGAEINIVRFLACLEYSFVPGLNSICHNHEYNFIYEVQSSNLKFDNEIPQLEKHIKLMWLPYKKLPDIDFRAEPFKVLIPQWINSNIVNNFESQMVELNAV